MDRRFLPVAPLSVDAIRSTMSIFPDIMHRYSSMAPGLTKSTYRGRYQYRANTPSRADISTSDILAQAIGISPKVQTGIELMRKTEIADQYFYMATTYRQNKRDIVNSLAKVKNAISSGRGLYALDLETMTGVDAQGKYTHDAITEIALISNGVLDKNGKPVKDVVEFLGLNPKFSNDYKTLISSYVSSLNRINDFDDGNMPKIKELLKYGYIARNQVIDNFYSISSDGRVVLHKKPGNEVIDNILKRSNKDEIEDLLNSGLEFLTSNYNENRYLSAIRRVRNRLSGDNIVVGANIINFDAKVLRSLTGIDIPAENMFDITEVKQVADSIISSGIKHAATMDSIIAASGLSNQVTQSHIAAEDAMNVFKVLNWIIDVPGAEIEKSLSDNDLNTFKVNNIYWLSDPVRASFAFRQNPALGFTRASKTGALYNRSGSRIGISGMPYDTVPAQNMAYELFDYGILDLTQNSKEMRSVRNNLYKASPSLHGEKKLHVVGLKTHAPNIQTPQADTLEELTEKYWLVLSDDEFNRLQGGMLNIGFIGTDGTPEYFTEKLARYGLIDKSPYQNYFRNLAVSKAQENAYHNFRNNPYQYVKAFIDSTSDKQRKSLADAIASRDIKRMQKVSRELLETTMSSSGISYEAKKHLGFIKNQFFSYSPIINGIAKGRPELLEKENQETFNTVFNNILDNLLFLDSEHSRRIDLNNQLVINLRDAASNAYQSDRFALNFDDPFEAANMADRLINIFYGDMAPSVLKGTSYPSYALSSIEKFLNVASRDGYVGRDVSKIIKKNNLLKRGHLNLKSNVIANAVDGIEGGAYSERGISAISTAIFNLFKNETVYGDKVRSEFIDIPVLFSLPPVNDLGEYNYGFRYNGVLIKSPGELTDAVAEIVSKLTLPTEINKNNFNNFVLNNLLPAKFDEYKKTLLNLGYNEKEASLRSELYRTSAQDYANYLKNLVETFSERGITFDFEGDQIYARSASARSRKTRRELIQIPIMRIDERTGAVYLESGNMNMKLSFGFEMTKGGKPRLTTMFSGYKASKQAIERYITRRDSTKVNLDDLISYTKFFNSGIIQSDPEFLKVSSINNFGKYELRSSGALFYGYDVFKNFKELDTHGYLTTFKRERPEDYEALRNYFNSNKKVTSISGAGIEIANRFSQSVPSIYKSIAQTMNTGDMRSAALANVLRSVNLQQTSETMLQHGVQYIGNATTALANTSRPVWLAIQKSEAIDVSNAAKFGFNNFGEVIGDALNPDDVIESVGGTVRGRTRAIQTNAVRLSQKRYLELIDERGGGINRDNPAIAKLINKYNITNEDIEKVLRRMRDLNLENDSAIISDRLARGLGVSIDTTKYKSALKYTHDKINELIPGFKIDEKGTVRVKYKPGILYKIGDTLNIKEIAEDVSHSSKITSNSIFRFLYTDKHGVVVGEEELSKYVFELMANNIYGIGNIFTPTGFARFNEILSKKFGITGNYVLETIEQPNIKIGLLEEKMTAESLSLAFGDLSIVNRILESKKYKKKWRAIRDVYYGKHISNAGLEYLRSYLNLSNQDYEAIYVSISAPTIFAQNMLFEEFGRNIDVIENTAPVKHGVERLWRDLASLREVMSPEEFNSLINNKEIFTGINFDMDASGNLRVTTFGELSYNASKFLDIYSSYVNNKLVNPDVYPVAVHKMSIWSGNKFSGLGAAEYNKAKDLFEKELSRARSMLDVGDTDLIDQAKASVSRTLEHFINIDKNYMDLYREAGVKIGPRDISVLQRQIISSYALEGILSDDSDYGRQVKEYLANKGILTKIGDRYEISSDYARRGRSMHEDFISDVKRSAMNDGRGLTAGTFADAYSLGIDKIPERYDHLRNKILDKKYRDFSLDKLELMDIAERYEKLIRPFNEEISTSVLTEQEIQERISKLYEEGDPRRFKVINVADMALSRGGIYDFVKGDPNSPYGDVVLDFGNKMDPSRRFLALSYSPEKTFEGEFIKNEYQDKFSSANYWANVLRDSTGEEAEQARERLSQLYDEMRQAQEREIFGKQHPLLSARARHSAILESSTMVLDTANGDFPEWFRQRSFDGLSLEEHFKQGRMFDMAEISMSKFEAMGMLDENFAKSYIDRIREEKSEVYSRMMANVRENASYREQMSWLLQNEGIAGYLGRNPKNLRGSITPTLFFASDMMSANNAIRVFHITQNKMKNDNDGDTIELMFQASNSSIEDALRINAHINKSEYQDLVGKKAQKFLEESNYAANYVQRAILGVKYSTYSSQDAVDASAYFESVRKSTDYTKYYEMARGDGNLDRQAFSDAFEDIITKNVEDEGTRTELRKAFIVDLRLQDYTDEIIGRAKKGEIGIVDLSLNKARTVLDNTLLGFLNNASTLTPEDALKYETLYEVSSNIFGALSESMAINAKNYSYSGAESMTAMFERSMSTLLSSTDSEERAKAALRMQDWFNTYGSKPIDDWIKKYRDSKSLLDYSGLDTIGDADIEKVREKIVSDLMDVYQSSNAWENKGFIDSLGTGTSNYPSKLSSAMLLTYEGRDAFIRQFQEQAGSQFDETLSKEFSESANEFIKQNISSGARSSSSGGFAKAFASEATGIFRTIPGKSLALGALGIAAAVMMAGFVGGNPSEPPAPRIYQPQQQVAYAGQESFDYGDTQYQQPQQGYVVNMRGKTNGSFIRTRQNVHNMMTNNMYGNVHVTMNVKTAYSPNMSNDMYVEQLLSNMLNK